MNNGNIMHQYIVMHQWMLLSSLSEGMSSKMSIYILQLIDRRNYAPPMHASAFVSMYMPASIVRDVHVHCKRADGRRG
jgi:hypothetical protein